jgi:hypothetical protein
VNWAAEEPVAVYGPGARRPNPRVQRTRVARCARPGSPLTRHPLGGGGMNGVPEFFLLARVAHVATRLRVG